AAALVAVSCNGGRMRPDGGGGATMSSGMAGVGAGTTGAAGAVAGGTTGDAGPAGAPGGLGPFVGLEAGPLSAGATLTFQMIGAAGSYFSRRDPAVGPCDAYRNGTCCMTSHAIAGTALTPWNEELGVTLR